MENKGLHIEDVLLHSRMLLKTLKKASTITSLDESEQQNFEINENLSLLNELYAEPDISKGLAAAISETYFLYYRKARELYVATLNIALKDSNIGEDTLKYFIEDDSLTLSVEGVFSDKTVDNFLDIEILDTILHLGFVKLNLINPETKFRVTLFREEMEKITK